MKTIQSYSIVPALLAVLFGIQLSAFAASAPPERMTYQGFLVDGNGIALGQTAPQNYDVIFRIHTDQTDGTLKWSEQQTVTVDKGYFSVLLGEGSRVNTEVTPAALSSLFTGTDASERYIEITVKGIGSGNTDETILPRLKLVTSPYAFLASHVVADAVGTSEIAANAVTQDEIAADAVTASEIAANAVTASEIAANAVTASEIAVNAVGASEIAANAVGTSEVANNSLTQDDLAANAVGASEIAANAVGASEIAALAVGTSEVADNSLTANDLAVGSVGTSEVADNSLTANDLAANSVGASEIAANAVGNSEIANGAVTTAKLEASWGSPPKVYNVPVDGRITISDAVVREYLADGDGGRVRIIIIGGGSGPINDRNYVLDWYCDPALSAPNTVIYPFATFHLGAGAVQQNIAFSDGYFLLSNYTLGSTGDIATDHRLYAETWPNYSAKVILYDH